MNNIPPNEEMDDLAKVIRQARKLVAMSKRATSGPWSIRRVEDFPVQRNRTWLYIASNGKQVAAMELASQTVADMRFIATAPEMAKLLERMADELEDARNVLANWCKHECASTLQVYGRHAPNCPYEELGWADD